MREKERNLLYSWFDRESTTMHDGGGGDDDDDDERTY